MSNSDTVLDLSSLDTRELEEVKEAMPTSILPSDEPDYAWLEKVAEDDCFMPLDQTNTAPTKSLDFGLGGVTGSVSAWHELLQMTASDAQCGVIFLRGHFPDNPDAILSRAQRRNQTGTFGLELKIDESSEYVLERTPAQGMINLRWPYSRYGLVWAEQDKHGRQGSFASQSSCSFVKDQTLYQMIRVTPNKLLGSEPASETASLTTAESPSLCDVVLQVGGYVRFGCYSSSHTTDTSTTPNATGSTVSRNLLDQPTFAGPTLPVRDDYKVLGPQDGASDYVLALVSTNYERRLEIRVWVNGERLKLVPRPTPAGEPASSCSKDSEFGWLYTRHPLKLYQDRALNIVATYSLVPSQEPISVLRDPIGNRETMLHTGVTDISRNASYRLWAAVLGEVPGPDNTEAFELNAIGRCIEEVIGVLAVPVKMNVSNVPEQHSSSGSPPSSHSNNSGTASIAEKTKDYGIALIQNIMENQVVDLESTLWYTRLLVHASHALQHTPALFEQTDGSGLRSFLFSKMQQEHRSRVSFYIRGILVWMCHIIPVVCLREEGGPQFWISPSDVNPVDFRRSNRKCRPVQPATDEEAAHKKKPAEGPQSRKMRLQKWYCGMILWYLIKQMKELVADDPEVQGLCWTALKALAAVKNNVNETSTALVEDAYRCMLRWYHSHSIVEIYEALRKMREPGLDPSDSVQIDTAEHHKYMKQWQAKAEKAIRSFGQGRLVRQCVGHEDANLAMFGQEIGIDTSPLKQQGQSVIEYIKTLIEKRHSTEKVNSGAPKVKRWDVRNVRSAVARPGPWELSCLAHHLPINLGIASNAEECMTSCKEFLLADWTFIPSWDHSKAFAVGLWWDLTTSAIIATQLLAARNDSSRAPLRHSKSSVNISLGAAHTDSEPTKGQIMTLSAEQEDRFQGKLDRVLEALEQSKEVLEQSKPKASDEQEGFTWKKRGPGLIFHADSSVQSLEDTPDVFRLKQTRNVQVRSNIKLFLKNNHLTRTPDYSLAKFQEHIPASKLRHFSCIDFSLARTDNDMPEVGISFIRGRMDKKWLGEFDDGPRLLELLGLKEQLWDFYFMDPELRNWRFGKFNDTDKALLKKAHPAMLKAYGDSLSTVLNDSLVDLGTKYRILFAKRLSPTLLQPMIYMWHSDALDTFDDHLGSISQFHDGPTNINGNEMWYTTITLSHWRLQRDVESELSKIVDDIEEREKQARAKEEEDDRKRRQKEAEGETDAEDAKGAETADDMEVLGSQFPETFTADFPIPPPDVSHSRPAKNRQPRGTKTTSSASIRQLSMSLTISGDTMGRYWTCTLICDLMSEPLVTSYVGQVREILQMFIHQQYTGRSLVFVLLLGYMCESLALECEKFMEQLNDITGMGPMVLLNGLKWHKPEVALKGLKDMLWGLEALRVFDDKLSNALERIDEAKAKMKNRCDYANDIRPLDMRREKDRVWEEFSKRYSRLRNAHSSINQRIDQGSRLREGITSVLSVEQNENISMLTWVTIVYLPVSFIATIFSMGHGIVPVEAGWTTFGWLIAVFLVGTMLFALSLEFIIRYVRKTETAAAESWAKFRQKKHGHDTGGEDITLADQGEGGERGPSFTRFRSAGSLRRQRVVREIDIEGGPREDGVWTA